MVLQGKDRPDYDGAKDMGDAVVVINADKLVFTGKKMDEKVYYRHSGHPGNLKKVHPSQLMAKYGGAPIVWNAVRGMLPKNKLRKRRLDKLLIYNNDDHDFDEQYMFPLSMPSRRQKPHKLCWNLPDGFEPMNTEAFLDLWNGSRPDLQDVVHAIHERHAREMAEAPPLEHFEDRALRQGIRLQ